MKDTNRAYKNPVIPGFHPDPSVCRVGSDFYLVTSSFQYFPGVPIFHSRDLVHWEQVGHCLTRRSQLDLEECKSSLGIFAPTLRYANGRFYMITTNTNRFKNFYVWANQADGPWSDPIWLDWPGIDPSLFFDEDGRVYITGTGGFMGDEPLGIYQAEIDIETCRMVTERRFIWSGTGGKAPEGPHLYKIHGHYYLLIAEGGTEYGHMACIARSDNPYGPFESNPANPILTHRSIESPIQATGHADFVEDGNGNWWAVFLGIRPAPVMFAGLHHHMGRETFLAQVNWSLDGWPLLGESGKVLERMNTGSLPLSAEQPWAEVDDFDNETLDVCWNFLRNPRSQDWSLTERPGWLTLRGSDITLDAVGSPTFVGRRQQHFNCDVCTRLCFSPSAEGEEAGLTVFMNERFHYEIALTVRGGHRKIIFRRRIGSLWKVELEANYMSEEIVIGVQCDPTQYSFYYEQPNGDRQPFGAGECSLLSTEVAGGFTGIFFGLYAAGNKKLCTVPARFDWFRYSIH